MPTEKYRIGLSLLIIMVSLLYFLDSAMTLTPHYYEGRLVNFVPSRASIYVLMTMSLVSMLLGILLYLKRFSIIATLIGEAVVVVVGCLLLFLVP